MLPIALGLAGVASFVLYFGLRRPAAAVSIEERLAQFSERQYSLEELELSQPFSQRIVAPVFLRLARSVSRFTPRSNSEKLRIKLMEAGSPSKLGVTEFMGLKIVLAGLLSGLIFLMLAASGMALMQLVLFPAVVGTFGYMMPGIWLDRKIKDRKKHIQMSLADAIDLLTISVEAGLGFDPALQRVAEKWDNELTWEFRRMLHEMRIGKSRREAMRELATRCNVEDLNVFVASIIQADQLGVSITQVLRTQSKQLRVRRRQRAQEQAQKAPIKMLFPMVFLIFPALYVILLGPAIPKLVAAF
ncbi:MAG: type II secretion system F family protein [Thermomicrobiales bacterium]